MLRYIDKTRLKCLITLVSDVGVYFEERERLNFPLKA